MTVQFFRNGMLMEQDGVVRPRAAPSEPGRFGVDLSPAPEHERAGLLENLFITSYNPYGIDTSNLPGRRHIVVSISEQTLTAYQGDQVVLQTLVSGPGAERNRDWCLHVRIKYPMQDMQGFTSSTGEVVSVGSKQDRASSTWSPMCPTCSTSTTTPKRCMEPYWHNNFGNRMSHGCINLPLDVADFIYEWAHLAPP